MTKALRNRALSLSETDTMPLAPAEFVAWVNEVRTIIPELLGEIEQERSRRIGTEAGRDWHIDNAAEILADRDALLADAMLLTERATKVAEAISREQISNDDVKAAKGHMILAAGIAIARIIRATPPAAAPGSQFTTSPRREKIAINE